eukprot:SAG31_NODE_2533_length_5554_cov_2.350623_5_plen_64_part_00
MAWLQGAMGTRTRTLRAGCTLEGTRQVRASLYTIAVKNQVAHCDELARRVHTRQYFVRFECND